MASLQRDIPISARPDPNTRGQRLDRVDAKLITTDNLVVKWTISGGGLANLVDVDSNQTITGTKRFSSIKTATIPSTSDDVANKEYVDVKIGANNPWMLPVITRTITTPPMSPADGDRYLIDGEGLGAWLGHTNETAEWTVPQEEWAFTEPIINGLVMVNDEKKVYLYTGNAWVEYTFSIDHNTLVGLQGGAASEMYHVSAEQSTYLAGITEDVQAALDARLRTDIFDRQEMGGELTINNGDGAAISINAPDITLSNTGGRSGAIKLVNSNLEISAGGQTVMEARPGSEAAFPGLINGGRALYVDDGRVLRTSTVTPAELGRLSGVLDPIQTQLDSKAAITTLANYLSRAGGTMEGPITYSPATISRAAMFNEYGVLVSSTVKSNELEYLSGINAPLTTLLGTKADAVIMEQYMRRDGGVMTGLLDIGSSGSIALNYNGIIPGSVLCLNGSNNIITSSITSDELGRLVGLTSNITDLLLTKYDKTGGEIGGMVAIMRGSTGKKLSLYETVSNAYQYQGLGATATDMQYRINTNMGSHSFYAASSNTEEQKVMSISGGGVLSLPLTTKTSKVLAIDDSYNVVPTDVSIAELGYLSGLNDSLTTLLADKLNSTGDSVIATSATTSISLIKNADGTRPNFVMKASGREFRIDLSEATGIASFRIGSSNVMRLMSPFAVEFIGKINSLTLTADTVLVSDKDKYITSSAITTTQLGYLSGMTGPDSIQTQLNNRLKTNAAVTDQQFINGITNYVVSSGTLAMSTPGGNPGLSILTSGSRRVDINTNAGGDLVMSIGTVGVSMTTRLTIKRSNGKVVLGTTTASSVLTTNEANEITSSVVTPDDLLNIAGSAGNLQAQIGGLGSGLATTAATVEYMGGEMMKAMVKWQLEIATFTVEPDHGTTSVRYIIRPDTMRFGWVEHINHIVEYDAEGVATYIPPMIGMYVYAYRMATLFIFDNDATWKPAMGVTHNSFYDVQGGIVPSPENITGERYHLTEAQHAVVEVLPATLAAKNTIINPTSVDIMVHEGAAHFATPDKVIKTTDLILDVPTLGCVSTNEAGSRLIYLDALVATMYSYTLGQWKVIKSIAVPATTYNDSYIIDATTHVALLTSSDAEIYFIDNATQLCRFTSSSDNTTIIHTFGGTSTNATLFKHNNVMIARLHQADNTVLNYILDVSNGAVTQQGMLLLEPDDIGFKHFDPVVGTDMFAVYNAAAGTYETYTFAQAEPIAAGTLVIDHGTDIVLDFAPTLTPDVLFDVVTDAARTVATITKRYDSGMISPPQPYVKTISGAFISAECYCFNNNYLIVTLAGDGVTTMGARIFACNIRQQTEQTIAGYDKIYDIAFYHDILTVTAAKNGSIEVERINLSSFAIHADSVKTGSIVIEDLGVNAHESGNVLLADDMGRVMTSSITGDELNNLAESASNLQNQIDETNNNMVADINNSLIAAKAYTDTMVASVGVYLAPVISAVDVLPDTGSMSAGDRYLILTMPNVNNIYEHPDIYTMPADGASLVAIDTGNTWIFTGTEWTKISAQTDHNFLINVQGGLATEKYHLSAAEVAAVQTIGAKANAVNPTTSGTLTHTGSIKLPNESINKALALDNFGNIISSDTPLSSLNHLKDVTANVQTQLNDRVLLKGSTSGSQTINGKLYYQLSNGTIGMALGRNIPGFSFLNAAGNKRVDFALQADNSGDMDIQIGGGNWDELNQVMLFKNNGEIRLPRVTAGRALMLNSNQAIVPSAASSVELDRIKGLKGPINDQLNERLSMVLPTTSSQDVNGAVRLVYSGGKYARLAFPGTNPGVSLYNTTEDNRIDLTIEGGNFLVRSGPSDDTTAANMVERMRITAATGALRMSNTIAGMVLVTDGSNDIISSDIKIEELGCLKDLTSNIKSKFDTYDASLTTIGSDIATINTNIGTIGGNITTINSNIAAINNTKLKWQDPVHSFATEPTEGNDSISYIIDPATLNFIWIDYRNYIVRYDEFSTRTMITPVIGMHVFAESEGRLYVYESDGAWHSKFIVQHNNFADLQGGDGGEEYYHLSAEEYEFIYDLTASAQAQIDSKLAASNTLIDTTSNASYGLAINADNESAKVPPRVADKIGDVVIINQKTPTVDADNNYSTLNPPALVITRPGINEVSWGAGAAFTLEKVATATSDSNSALKLQLLNGGNSSYVDAVRFRYDGVEFSNQIEDTVPYLNAAKVLTSSAVTPAELGRLSGARSKIQDQLDAKLGNTGDVVISTDGKASISLETSTARAYFRMNTVTNDQKFWIDLSEATGTVAFRNGAASPIMSMNSALRIDTSGPLAISSTAMGSKKLILYDSGSSTQAFGFYGLGVTANSFDFHAKNNADYNWHSASSDGTTTTKHMTLSSGGALSLENLSTDCVVVTNGSKQLISSGVTAAQLDLLKELTGTDTINTRLNNRLMLTPPTTTETQTINSRVKIAIDTVGSFELTSPGGSPGLRFYNVDATMRSDIRQEKATGDLVIGIGADALVVDKIRLVRATGGIKLSSTTASRVAVTNAANEIITSNITTAQLDLLSGLIGTDTINTRFGYTLKNNALITDTQNMNGRISMTHSHGTTLLGESSSSSTGFHIRNTAMATPGKFDMYIRTSDGAIIMRTGPDATRITALAIRSDGLVSLQAPTINATTVPYLDSNKNLISSAVTPTELGLLSGLTGTDTINTRLADKLGIKDALVTTTTNATYGFRMNAYPGDVKVHPNAVDRYGDVFTINQLTPTVTATNAINTLNPPALMITRRGVSGQSWGAGAAFTLEKLPTTSSDSHSALRLQLLTGGNASYADIIRFRHNGVELMGTNVTADTVPYLNASKILTSSTVTSTELGLLKGLGTVSIKDQLAATVKTDLATNTTQLLGGGLMLTNTIGSIILGYAYNGNSIVIRNDTQEVKRTFISSIGNDGTCIMSLGDVTSTIPILALKPDGGVQLPSFTDTDKVLYLDSNKAIKASTITTAQLELLSGLTGTDTINTRLGNKLDIAGGSLTGKLTIMGTTHGKKLSIYNGGFNNDHEFYGFSSAASEFRFHTTDSSSDFVFNVGLTSSSSREVFRVKGSGAIKAPFITASRVLTTNAVNELVATETVTPTQLESLKDITGNVQTRLAALETNNIPDPYTPSMIFVLNMTSLVPVFMRNDSRIATKAISASISSGNRIRVVLSPWLNSGRVPVTSVTYDLNFNAVVNAIGYQGEIEFKFNNPANGSAFTLRSQDIVWITCVVWG